MELGVVGSKILTVIIILMGSSMGSENTTDIMDLISDSNFEDIISKTLGNEGGYKAHHEKYGGETNYGIPKKFYPDVDIKALTRDNAKEIYRKDFYEGPGINKIAYPDVAYKVFDFGVTSGPTDSIKLLQETLNGLGGNLKVDGVLGNNTLSELYKHKPEDISAKFESGVINHYKSLRTRKYMKGWLRRARNK